MKLFTINPIFTQNIIMKYFVINANGYLTLGGNFVLQETHTTIAPPPQKMMRFTYGKRHCWIKGPAKSPSHCSTLTELCAAKIMDLK